MSTDYLKLAREARERALRDQRRWGADFAPGIPALCDAIEVQAAEIDRLKASLEELQQAEDRR